jgi:hypothetical protein
MRRQAVLEKNLVTRIMRALRSHNDLIVRKRHGTAMGVTGDPDLYGSFRGRHFEIEVKRPGGSSELTELQRRRLQEWEHSGAIVGVARNVEDAMTILSIEPPAALP